jgi:hypothetical protein
MSHPQPLPYTPSPTPPPPPNPAPYCGRRAYEFAPFELGRISPPSYPSLCPAAVTGCARCAGELRPPQGGWDAAAGEEGTSLLKTSDAARVALAGAVEGSCGDEVQEAEGAAALHALEVRLYGPSSTSYYLLLTTYHLLLTTYYLLCTRCSYGSSSTPFFARSRRVPANRCRCRRSCSRCYRHRHALAGRLSSCWICSR